MNHIANSALRITPCRQGIIPSVVIVGGLAGWSLTERYGHSKWALNLFHFSRYICGHESTWTTTTMMMIMVMVIKCAENEEIDDVYRRLAASSRMKMNEVRWMLIDLLGKFPFFIFHVSHLIIFMLISSTCLGSESVEDYFASCVIKILLLSGFEPTWELKAAGSSLIRESRKVLIAVGVCKPEGYY